MASWTHETPISIRDLHAVFEDDVFEDDVFGGAGWLWDYPPASVREGSGAFTHSAPASTRDGAGAWTHGAIEGIRDI